MTLSTNEGKQDMIKPTVGRVVWLYASAAHYADCQAGKDQPEAAIISHVFSDGMVNLAAFDRNGESYGRTSVPLLQEEDGTPEGDSPFCAWMPYQVGQAKAAATAAAATPAQPKQDAAPQPEPA